MEQLLLGLVLFNAIFQPNDLEYDTFEVGQVTFAENKESDLMYNPKLVRNDGMSFGSRTYEQAASWIRYGHGTYIYGQNFASEDDQRELSQYGGYAGFLLELNYKRYFGIGVLIGGGATYTEFNDSNLNEHDRSNYFGLASPYITLGLPITKTGSINFTASSYYLSDPAEQIDGAGEGFEPPHNLESKFGLEIVWSWE